MKKIITFLMILAVLSSTAVFANGASESSEGKTVLKIAQIYDPMGDKSAEIGYAWFKDMEKEYEAANPDVDIQLETFSWDQIDVKMMQDYKAGVKSHDIFMSTPQLYALHAEVGDTEDLTPYLEKDWSKEEIEAISWSSTFRQGNINGVQHGLPMGSHVRLGVYNKDMFVAAGLDPEKGPTTLEELVEYAQKLTLDKDGDGKTDQWGLGIALGPDRATVELTFLPILWNFNGSLWDQATNSATINTPEAIKSLEYIWDLINTYKVVDPGSTVKTNNAAICDMFTQNRAAIGLGFGSYWVGVLEDLGFIEGVRPATAEGRLVNMGIIDYPTTCGSGFANSWSISMFKNSEKKDVAWDFLNYMFRSEALDVYPAAGLPIRASVWEKPEYQTEYYTSFKHAIEIGQGVPVSPYYGELADTVAAAIQIALQSEKSEIPQILANAEQEFNSKYAGK